MAIDFTVIATFEYNRAPGTTDFGVLTDIDNADPNTGVPVIQTDGTPFPIQDNGPEGYFIGDDLSGGGNIYQGFLTININGTDTDFPIITGSDGVDTPEIDSWLLLVPQGIDLTPYLDEARRLLHEETDYLREGRNLAAFGQRLSTSGRFVVPEFHADWSTARVLTMSYIAGWPIEDAAGLDQDARDRLAGDLMALFLRELFEFEEMQSDPNFANYMVSDDGQRIVLLDFGATRRIAPALVADLRDFLAAGLCCDDERVETLARRMGMLSDADRADHQAAILSMIAMVFSALRAAPVFDFAQSDLARRLQDSALAMAETGYAPRPLPMDLLYLQRKVAGMFLLARRLQARVPVQHLLRDHGVW